MSGKVHLTIDVTHNLKSHQYFRNMPNGKWQHENFIKEEFLMTTVVSLHNIDVAKFLAVLDTCKGNVYLVTREGDHLNLKSKLCQLIGLTQLIEGGKIAEAYVLCDDPEDESRLFRFDLFGEVETKTA